MVSSPFRRAVSGADGTVDFGTLPAGAWMLAETEAPAGLAAGNLRYRVLDEKAAEPHVRESPAIAPNAPEVIDPTGKRRDLHAERQRAEEQPFPLQVLECLWSVN